MEVSAHPSDPAVPGHLPSRGGWRAANRKSTLAGVLFCNILIKNHVNYWLHPGFQETFLRKMKETVKIMARHRLMAAPVDAPRW